MLQPKKVKHRKWHKGRSRKRQTETRGTHLSFGSFGIQSLESAWVNSRQIEAARKAITHFTKRGGKIWITVFPHKPLTKKAQEVPMGSGKGAPELFVCPVLPGRILFEMEGIDEATARAAMKLAAYKLPIKCKFISTTLK